MATVRGGITVKPHVQAFADACSEATGADNFGTYPGHSPPEGPTQALDIFNSDSAAGYALQDRICEFAMAHQKRFGVRYCIRRLHIWNIERAGEGWRRQVATGNRTADHWDHVHITFYSSGGSPAPKPSPVPTKEDELFKPSPPQTFHIAAAHSGLFFDLPGLGSHGAPLETYPSDGGPDQRLELVGHEDGTLSFRFRTEQQLVIDVPDGRAERNVQLRAWEPNWSPAQRFRRIEVGANEYVIEHVSGLRLDVFGSGGPAARVGLWTPTDGANQRFRFLAVA